MNNRHNYILDNEVIGLSENLKLPISEIFLECVECNHILRGHEIVEYIQRLEAKPDIRDLAEWIRARKKKHEFENILIAEEIIFGDGSLQEDAERFVSRGETAAWIVCAAIKGERDAQTDKLFEMLEEA